MFVCLSRSYIAGTVHIINILYSYVKKDIFSLLKERILSQGFSQRSTVASKVPFLTQGLPGKFLFKILTSWRILAWIPLVNIGIFVFFSSPAEAKARVAGDRGGIFFPEKLLVKVPAKLLIETPNKKQGRLLWRETFGCQMRTHQSDEYWILALKCAEIVNSHWWFVIKDYEWFWILNFL